MEEVSIIVNFANSFYPRINFSCEMSSERAVFLDTEVFKGPRFQLSEFSIHKLISSPLKLISIHSSHPATHSIRKKVRRLRTNSVNRNFYNYKRDFKQRLFNRGYPTALVRKILTKVQFSDRTEALRNKTEKAKEVLPFVTTYNPATPNLKKILMKNWHIIQQQPRLPHIFN